MASPSYGLAFAFLASLASGCGEDGQGIRESGKCPAQPLYHYEFTGADGGGRWVAFHPSQVPPATGADKAFTADEQAALSAAINGATAPGGGPRCLTPIGSAKTLSDAGN